MSHQMIQTKRELVFRDKGAFTMYSAEKVLAKHGHRKEVLCLKQETEPSTA